MMHVQLSFQKHFGGPVRVGGASGLFHQALYQRLLETGSHLIDRYIRAQGSPVQFITFVAGLC